MTSAFSNRRYGAGFWGPGAGIIHQVVLEHYAFAGELIIGTDSHTPNAGGLGACAVGVGGADAVDVMAGLPWEVLYPTHIAVYLTGKLSGWTAPKDVILYVAGQLTVAGAPTPSWNISVPARARSAPPARPRSPTWVPSWEQQPPCSPMMSEWQNTCGRQAEATWRHWPSGINTCSNRTRKWRLTLTSYERVVRLDLSKLEPYVVGPHSPDRARPISKLAAEVTDTNNQFCDDISTALIGSCTNSSYEDMSRAADVAEQAKAHGIKTAVPFLVTPGSEQVRATIERDGQMQSLKDINGVVLANACGPCIGQWRRANETVGIPNTIVTSYNRNFPRRNDGQPTTMNFIGSTELVTALALAGRLSFNPLTDTLAGADGKPFKLEPPKPAPEVPAQSFARGRSAYIAPPENGSNIALKVDPHSERLQLLEPWPAWDGNDFLDMPVLMKTKGKTTTDHISPAGPWLSLRDISTSSATTCSWVQPTRLPARPERARTF